MGYLLRDHRSTVDWTEKRDGTLEEWDTVACSHCQAIIRIVLKGVNKAREHHRNCPDCKSALCKHCDEAYGKTRSCPGTIRAQIDRALARVAAARSACPV